VVEGVINLRGTIVPVLDIRARFGLAPKAIEISDHLVIARAQNRVVAIRVDRVINLMTFAAGDIEDLSDAVPNSDYLAGVAKLPDGMVLIHDLARFLSEAEAAALNDLAGPRQP
jgi:purine-binding chemotaxis protein CheW